MTAVAQGYASAFQTYRDLGWSSPIKLKRGTKKPPPTGFTGNDGVDPSGADMQAWADDEPDGNLALRLPNNDEIAVVGIDVDAYAPKNGGATYAEAVKRWGALPDGPRSSSRPDDPVSGIRPFRVPAGTVLEESINFDELNIGDIEIIQRQHRYAVVWPSIHREGRLYQWYDGDGNVMETPPAPGDLPWLPQAWVDGLRNDKPSTNGADLSEVVACDVAATLTEGQPSRQVAERLAEALNAACGPTRHVKTCGHVLALMRLGKNGEPGVFAALRTLRQVFITAVTADGTRTLREAEGEFERYITNKRAAQLLAWSNTQWFDDWARECAAKVEAHSSAAQDVVSVAEAIAAIPSAPTTWEAMDLWPYLRGEIELPKPSIGITRSDGVRMLYAGREHAVIGETESGKTWVALQCVAIELLAGNHVVYIHYEEGDPTSTVERLQLLGVSAEIIARHLRFVAPSRNLADVGWLAALLCDPAPTLVVHDGVNEAMALHGLDIFTADGAASFRRWLVSPAIRAGAAVLSCDHLPKNRDGQSRDAYGSVHKGNALDGARFVLENVEPFGRGLRGRSNVFVTKDRPGHLRAHGRTTTAPGKTFVGTLVADDADPFTPFSLMLYAPRDEEEAACADAYAAATELRDAMFDVIAALPDRTAGSAVKLYAAMRAAGHKSRDTAYRAIVEDLIHTGNVEEVPGKRGALGYRAVVTSSQEKTA